MIENKINKAVKDFRNSERIRNGMLALGLSGIVGMFVGSMAKEVSLKRTEEEVRKSYAVPSKVEMSIEERDGNKVSVYQYNGRSYTMNFDEETNTVRLTPYSK